jgi:2'-5' RNA ligase
MRLFVAVRPPPEALTDLERAVAAVRPLAPDLRWTLPAQWHLTLTFLGDVADDDVPDLEGRLARAAARHPPLALWFRAAGRFGSRVLITRLDGDREPLRRLAAATSAAARRCGLAVEDRPYRPHLTLARSDGGTDLRPLVEALAPFEGVPWEADRLELVRSRLGQGEGRRSAHDSIGAWPLTGAGRPG